MARASLGHTYEDLSVQFHHAISHGHYATQSDNFGKFFENVLGRYCEFFQPTAMSPNTLVLYNSEPMWNDARTAASTDVIRVAELCNEFLPKIAKLLEDWSEDVEKRINIKYNQLITKLWELGLRDYTRTIGYSGITPTYLR